jgi:hypothetical protein
MDIIIYTNYMRFCICFFGVISRSLTITIESIKKNIFDVLKKNNINYDVFVHNNKIDKIYNERNNACEKNIEINNDEYKLLNPTKYQEDQQSIFDESYDWKIKQNTSIKDNICKNTYKNAIRQLHSVKRVTEMWENGEKYDLYLYIRPDLLYVNKLDINQILKNINKQNILFTPNWENYNGLNDRIYFGKQNVMLKIAKRIDLIPVIYKSNKYNAEMFMKLVVDYYGINTVYINLRGERIRSNGKNQEVINLVHFKKKNINYIRKYKKLTENKFNKQQKILKKNKLLINKCNNILKNKKFITESNSNDDNNIFNIKNKIIEWNKKLKLKIKKKQKLKIKKKQK